MASANATAPRIGDQRSPMALVHAGQDYDAWSEWDIDLWFEEGRPGNQVLAWRHLINRDVLIVPKAGEPGKLIQAILDSRKGQAELSSVLGERVRQAVEEPDYSFARVH